MALGDVIARLSIQLGLDTADFEKGASDAARRSKRMGDEMEALGHRVGKSIRSLAIAGVAIGGAVGLAGKKFAEMGKQIENGARLANAGVEEFQRAAAAAKTVGIEQEKLADIFKDTNDKVGEFLATGGGELKDFFETIAPKVGVTAEQFRRLSGPEALQLYFSSLEKANVNQQQAVFFMESIADEASALIPLLRDNGAEMKRLGQQTQVYTKADLEGLKRLNRAYEDLGRAVQGLGVALARSGILDGLSAIVNGSAKLVSGLDPVIAKLQQYGSLVGGLAGAAAGGRIGGVPGAIIGAGAGTLIGESARKAGIDGNMDVGFRLQQLNLAREQLERARKGGVGGLFELHQGRGAVGLRGAIDRVKKEVALLNRARELWRAGAGTATEGALTGPGITAPTDGGSSKGGGSSGPSTSEIGRRFDDELAGYAQQVLSARQSMATSAAEQAELELRGVELARLRTLAGIKAEKDYSAIQKQRLTQEVESLAEVERESVYRAQRLREEDEAADLARQQFDAQRDRLQAQLALADTETERQRIAMDLLAVDQQMRRDAMERVIASGFRTDAEKALAQLALDQLNANASLERAAVARSNETTVQAYLRSLRQTPDQINEAFDRIKIDGLEALNDGLADVITGARNMGEVFKNVANQVINDLARIAIRRSIIEPLANALFGGPKLSGVNFGALASAAGSVKIPGFARGTMSAPRGWAWAGERGPELVQFRGGERVFNNRDSRAMMGGRQVVEIVDTTGLFRFAVNGQIMEAAPAIASAGSTGAQVAMNVRQSRRFP